MECQEFAYETVVDRGIIRSPAKRNRSPGGPGKCFLRFVGFFFAISVARGLDVDKPRNLAKSVTVE